MLSPLRLAPLLLLAVTTGCKSTGGFWDERDNCLKDPHAYEAIPPWEAAPGESSFHPVEPAEGDAPPSPPAPVALRIERRGCSFRVRVRAPQGTTWLGPYMSVESALTWSATQQQYALLAHEGPQKTRLILDGVESPAHESIDRPVFSASGAHVAYIARDVRDSALLLDGAVIARGDPNSAPTQVLDVLSDGRAAFTQRAPDGRALLVVGAWKSEPYDELRNFNVWRGARFSVSLRHGVQWETVIDGRSEPLMGEPVSAVTFSPDGAHAVYVVYRGDTKVRRYEAMLDGVARPLPPSNSTSAPTVRMWGSEAVMDLVPAPEASAASRDYGYSLVGHSAPAAAPTRDDYTRAHAGKDGMFFQIGESRGPQFDRIEPLSLFIDEQGRARYRGVRGSEVYEVVDNVIQALPLVTRPALQVPAATPPP